MILYFIAGFCFLLFCLLVGAFVGVMLAAMCMIGSSVDAHIEEAAGEWIDTNVVLMGDNKLHRIKSSTASTIELEKESE